MLRIRIGAEPHQPDWIRDDATGRPVRGCLLVIGEEPLRPGIEATLRRIDLKTGVDYEERVFITEVCLPTDDERRALKRVG